MIRKIILGGNMNSGFIFKWIFLGTFLSLVFLFPHPSCAQNNAGNAVSVDSGGPFRGGWWLKTEWGADYVLMGDVVNGMKAWQSVYNSNAIPNTLSVGNIGWQGNFEVGLNLDPDNAFSIEVQQISSPTESITRPFSGNSDTTSVTPTLQDVSLN